MVTLRKAALKMIFKSGKRTPGRFRFLVEQGLAFHNVIPLISEKNKKASRLVLFDSGEL
jgi:hypothetical protein